MINSIIESLTKTEISAFKKFIASPFFARRADYALLFNTIVQQLRRKKGVDKAQLFQKTYGDLTFDDVKLRAALSDLKEQLEKFLVIQSFLEDERAQDLALLKCYGAKKLTKPFLQKLRKVESTLEQTDLQNSTYFQQKLQFKKMKMEALASQKRTADLPLQEISDQIDANFILEKLKHACIQLSHQLVYKTQYDFGLLDNVLSHLESGKFNTIPAIAIRYYCFQFLSHPKEKQYFDQFRDLLFEHETAFDREELKDLYLLGVNFCIRKLNQGDEFYPREAWRLYQKGLEAKVLLDDGQLARFTFNNVVGIGIHIREFAWLDFFVEKYQNYLSGEDKDSTIYFNRARMIYHAKKDYGAVIELLQKVDSKDIVENLMAKTMLSKVYFELNEFDLLDYHLTSFQQYIRRQKVGKYHKTNYNNIILFIRKCLSLVDYDKERRQQLREEINNTEILTERKWLLEQI